MVEETPPFSPKRTNKVELEGEIGGSCCSAIDWCSPLKRSFLGLEVP